jgi:membrane protein required for colicin V production
MTAFDYATLAILAISVAMGVFRGAVRELLSVVSWVVAGWLAWRFSPALAGILPSAWSNPTLRLVLAFIGVLIGGLLLFGLLGLALGALIRKGGLTGTDRLLGAFFGMARGVVVLVALVLVAGLTPLPREKAWRNAVLRGPLESLAVLARTYLPSPLASRIRYE